MRSSSLTVKTWFLAGFVAIVPTGAIATHLFYGEPRLDGHLCVTGQTPPAAHLVLIDRTDPLSPAARESIRLTLERLRGTMPLHARLTVYEVTRDERGPAAALLFDRCHPGDGSDRSRLLSNLRRLRERYERDFVSPLAAVLDDLGAQTVAPLTPLLQALHQVITQPDFVRVTGPRALWLFSDTIEHTDVLSMYGRHPFRFDAVRDWDPVAGVAHALTRVEVHVRQLTPGRPDVHQASLAAFWARYWQHTTPAALERTTL